MKKYEDADDVMGLSAAKRGAKKGKKGAAARSSDKAVRVRVPRAACPVSIFPLILHREMLWFLLNPMGFPLPVPPLLSPLCMRIRSCRAGNACHAAVSMCSHLSCSIFSLPLYLRVPCVTFPGCLAGS